MSSVGIRARRLISKAYEPESLRILLLTVVSLVGFLLIWWLLAQWLSLSYLPGPDEVFIAFVNAFTTVDASLGTNMFGNIAASLQRFLLGFGLAFGVAVPVGLVMGFLKLADRIAKPIVEIFRPIPPIAWVPVFLLIFQLFWGPVMVIFIGVFFPLLSNVIFGVKSVDPTLIDAARTLGADKLRLFGKVIFPYTVPFLMTGITIGLGIGWMCIVAAEMIGAVGGGVGYYIYYMEQLGRFEYMYAGMAVIAILGIVTVGLSRYVERSLSRRMGMK
ncbi:MAG: ABC transporter permease [Methanomassiliicoccales archaeon]|nr:ABC transporter permease [Methanomassiliicoccales archaeon]